MWGAAALPRLFAVHLRALASRPQSLDWAIAGALTAYAGIDVWVRAVVPGPRVVAFLGLAAMTVPLGFRRRWPLGVSVVSMAALAVETLVARGAPEGGVVLLPVLLVLYTVAVHESIRRALVGASVALVAVVVQTVQDPEIAGVGDIVLVDGFFLGILGTAAWLVGRYVRSRLHVEAHLQDRASSLERDTAELAAVVAAERGRIARELHDVIAHTVSVMGIQAAAAGEVLEHDPARARAALESIQATGRDAVDELRRLLAVLRDDSAAADLRPQPGLGRLEELVANAADAGLDVELSIAGAARPLPAGLELAAYRIVQEALTNVRKHAAARTARVVVDYRPGALELLVEDEGTGTSHPVGTGHGLVGMRERAELYGGCLDAGVRPTGGYAVRAVLPIGSGFR
jgi:signal transduction histidine kinase